MGGSRGGFRGGIGEGGFRGSRGGIGEGEFRGSRGGFRGGIGGSRGGFRGGDRDPTERFYPLLDGPGRDAP